MALFLLSLVWIGGHDQVSGFYFSSIKIKRMRSSNSTSSSNERDDKDEDSNGNNNAYTYLAVFWLFFCTTALQDSIVVVFISVKSQNV